MDFEIYVTEFIHDCCVMMLVCENQTQARTFMNEKASPGRGGKRFPLR